MRIDRALHESEPAGVPELVAKVPALDDLLLVEFDVLPLRRNPEKSESQAVRPVFGDEVERIG